MDSTFTERIAAINWTAFQTAYGRADDVPDQLIRLASADESTALRASHELWCGLCHQHNKVATAALPALPFLLEVMEAADEALVYEILDIILGLAKGVNRKRHVDFQETLGRGPLPDPEWVTKLRMQLIGELHRFRVLGTHSNADIAESAQLILQELSAEG